MTFACIPLQPHNLTPCRCHHVGLRAELPELRAVLRLHPAGRGADPAPHHRGCRPHAIVQGEVWKETR